MAAQADLIFKDRDTIVAELIAAMQGRIPDINTAEDSVFRIWVEVAANSLEGVMLAIQLMHNDMFPQTAQSVSLSRFGDMYAVPLQGGSFATGSLLFAGAGGTYIGLDTRVSAPQGVGDALDYLTTQDGTIPDPGIPTAPTIAQGASGARPAGTYEAAVTFLTTGGETAIGAISTPLVLAASKKIDWSAIATGGPGTTGRNLYRRVDGGAWGLVATINDNSTTTYTDDGAATTLPPDTSTAEQITLNAQAADTGTEYNVVAGSITSISDALPGLSSVANPSVFANGSGGEDLEHFRSRLLEFIRSPKSGSLKDLENWALTISGVESASAFNNDNVGTPTNGHATVRISGPGGSIPGSDVITAVQDLLDSKDLANITIHVATFTPASVDAGVTVTTATGVSVSDVDDSVQQAIINYIVSVPVGGTVYVAGVISAAMSVSGVTNIVVTQLGSDSTPPIADFTTTSTEKAVAGTITVS